MWTSMRRARARNDAERLVVLTASPSQSVVVRGVVPANPYYAARGRVGRPRPGGNPAKGLTTTTSQVVPRSDQNGDGLDDLECGAK